MTYNEANGPTYNQVKKSLGQNAVARVQYNKVSGNFGYIQKVKQAINLAQIHLKIKIISYMILLNNKNNKFYNSITRA